MVHLRIELRFLWTSTNVSISSLQYLTPHSLLVTLEITISYIMMRACTRPNLVEWPARPPALILVKAVEAYLQCFSAAEKSMNRKNSKGNGLRNSGLSWGWCLKPGHFGGVKHGLWFLHGSTRLLILGVEKICFWGYSLIIWLMLLSLLPKK